MIPVAYLHCPICFERRLFVRPPEIRDEYQCECSECEYTFGDPSTPGYFVQLSHATGVAGAEPRPAIDPEVLRAGMAEYQAEVAAELKRRHGGDHVYWAERRLHEGLGEKDPERRMTLLNSQPPGLVAEARRHKLGAGAVEPASLIPRKR